MEKLTFGLRGSLVVPPSSLASVFGLPSAPIVPSPDAPNAPLAEEKSLFINLIFQCNSQTDPKLNKKLSSLLFFPSLKVAAPHLGRISHVLMYSCIQSGATIRRLAKEKEVCSAFPPS